MISQQTIELVELFVSDPLITIEMVFQSNMKATAEAFLIHADEANINDVSVAMELAEKLIEQGQNELLAKILRDIPVEVENLTEEEHNALKFINRYVKQVA